jgi:methionine sulfoxide reductase catalytic subunit
LVANPQKFDVRYVQFTSFLDLDASPNQGDNRFPWPYTEGLTLDEARNELALLATGIYGKPIAIYLHALDFIPTG